MRRITPRHRLAISNKVAIALAVAGHVTPVQQAKVTKRALESFKTWYAEPDDGFGEKFWSDTLDLVVDFEVMKFLRPEKFSYPRRTRGADEVTCPC